MNLKSRERWVVFDVNGLLLVTDFDIYPFYVGKVLKTIYYLSNSPLHGVPPFLCQRCGSAGATTELLFTSAVVPLAAAFAWLACRHWIA